MAELGQQLVESGRSIDEARSAVLDKLNSPLGPVSDHEGIVIRDKSIYAKPFKITGKFILGGLASSFRK